MKTLESKVCNTCKEDLLIEKFDTNGWNDSSRKVRKYHAHCKPCTVKFINGVFFERMRKILGNDPECVLCGEDEYFALDFHHLDPSTKDIEIVKLRKSSFERLKKEVEKCAVLCANCHRKVHAGILTL